MGIAYADIELSNPRLPELETVRVRAMADTGSMMLCIPEHVCLQLALETQQEREVTLADGRKTKVPYVGPIRVNFANRVCFVGAFVLGREVLLGAIRMEDMDLVISPSEHKVTVNPDNPNFAHGIVMHCDRALAASA